MSVITITALGQDSHRFVLEIEKAELRPLLLGGIEMTGAPALAGNSDADVVLHALCNAISGLSAQPILGARADELCASGIRDSKVYVREALATLADIKLTHLSFAIEAARPHLSDKIPAMRKSIAALVDLPLSSVAITATSGEGLTPFGRGEGIQCFCLASAEKELTD
ncbi:MAG: 2-C-methyl-D-erythritol 2,4-cyclodiphosphate synthase [Eubacteriales bacterium]|nr:2-C-methyl-D-erythritol 2,4-cyclodiphosphate synthase [Eubacteriales bacterium]MDD4541236.1 2-C-methyl-D-erythritol 2,4-cyclodiphosphate synthase [Eubacteriales bacterium]